MTHASIVSLIVESLDIPMTHSFLISLKVKLWMDTTRRHGGYPNEPTLQKAISFCLWEGTRPRQSWGPRKKTQEVVPVVSQMRARRCVTLAALNSCQCVKLWDVSTHCQVCVYSIVSAHTSMCVGQCVWGRHCSVHTLYSVLPMCLVCVYSIVSAHTHGRHCKVCVHYIVSTHTSMCVSHLKRHQKRVHRHNLPRLTHFNTLHRFFNTLATHVAVCYTLRDAVTP